MSFSSVSEARLFCDCVKETLPTIVDIPPPTTSSKGTSISTTHNTNKILIIIIIIIRNDESQIPFSSFPRFLLCPLHLESSPFDGKWFQNIEKLANSVKQSLTNSSSGSSNKNQAGSHSSSTIGSSPNSPVANTPLPPQQRPLFMRKLGEFLDQNNLLPAEPQKPMEVSAPSNFRQLSPEEKKVI